MKKLSIDVFVPIAYTESYGKVKIIDVVEDLTTDYDFDVESDSNDVEMEDNLGSRSNFQCQHSLQNSILIKDVDVVSKLPNETILFDCTQENVLFQVINIQKQDLQGNGQSVNIKLNFKMDLEKVGKL